LYGKENPTRRDALCTLHKVLITALKLLHPFTPFITEEIFLSLQSEEETIMLSEWPEFDGALVFAKEEAEIEMIKEAVRGVRNVRLQMQVEPAKKIRIIAAAQTGEAYEAFTNGKAFFAFLAGAESVEVRRASEPEPAEKSAPVVLPGAVLYLPLDALVDAKKERARLEAEKIKIEKELARVNGKLGNEGFTAKAPPELIAEENAKREKYSAMLAQTQERLAALVNPSS
ncbi:MAG: class I tRNA ligase family protein, partial [Defluviitaleaceae bacterium]|nr:class I tRNA ligase family protein [Defluviitaleaceae bacterium]